MGTDDAISMDYLLISHAYSALYGLNLSLDKSIKTVYLYCIKKK